MGPVEADLGSWCACERVPTWGHLICPSLGSPFSHAPRAICTALLDCSSSGVSNNLTIKFDDGQLGPLLHPKGRRALLQIPSMEGRSVCLCWAPSKPRGPKGQNYSRTCTKETCNRAGTGVEGALLKAGDYIRHFVDL